LVAVVLTGFVFADAAIAQHVTAVQYIASLPATTPDDISTPIEKTDTPSDAQPVQVEEKQEQLHAAVLKEETTKAPEEKEEKASSKNAKQSDKKTTTASVPFSFKVPFYSQFKDITAAKWQKVGCGIASMAMLINYYQPGEVNVDDLLSEGIKAGAYLEDAGWIHQGLINLATKHGLTGETHDLSGSDMDTAFTTLTKAVNKGPVMASVHYTFDPKNPIPHLVVISGIKDGLVYYNDPAGKGAGESISTAKFQSAWKKRYIGVHPLS
jgi:uncharacterized protein YvpB